VQDALKPNAMFVDCPELDPELDHAVWKCGGDLAQEWAKPLLEVCLRLGVCVDMAGARQAQTRAQPPQIDPAQLSADGPPQALGDPGGDRAPVPAVVLRSGSVQCGLQLFRVRCGQHLSMWPGQTPLVVDTLRSTGIGAARDLANPVGRVAGEGSNDFGGEATRQEPEVVPAAALYWISGSDAIE
jgi:hypothetical protein